MSQTHQLKTVDIFWDAVARREKTFEIRKNDRGFQKGDYLDLIKVDEAGFPVKPANQYESNVITCLVTYVLQGGQFGIEPAYCVMGIEIMEPVMSDDEIEEFIKENGAPEDVFPYVKPMTEISSLEELRTHWCSDCERYTEATIDCRCVSCGSGRITRKA